MTKDVEGTLTYLIKELPVEYKGKTYTVTDTRVVHMITCETDDYCGDDRWTPCSWEINEDSIEIKDIEIEDCEEVLDENGNDVDDFLYDEVCTSREYYETVCEYDFKFSDVHTDNLRIVK